MFLLLHRTLRIRGGLVFVSPTLNQARVEGLVFVDGLVVVVLVEEG
jgi:hypothetical protein